MKVLVIVPAFNEAINIESVVEDICRATDQIDYMVINDCSTDDTRRILAEKRLNYIDLPINLGIGGCVQTGFRYADDNNYDIAVQFDGDGQHDAKFIERLTRPILNNEANVVIGSRFIECEGFQSSYARRFGINAISNLIYVLSGVKVYDVTSGMRAYDRCMIKYLAKNYEDDYPEPDALLAAALMKMKIQEVSVQMRERKGGKSSINFKRSIYYMVKVCSSLLLMKLMSTWKGNVK